MTVDSGGGTGVLMRSAGTASTIRRSGVPELREALGDGTAVGSGTAESGTICDGSQWKRPRSGLGSFTSPMVGERIEDILKYT